MFIKNSNVSLTNQDNIYSVWLTIVTEEVRNLSMLVNVIFLSSILSVFGIVGNIFNLFIFYRQGLNSTTNISFFVMAFSDLSCLLLQEWYIVLSFLNSSDLPFVYTDFQYITAGVPHEIFCRLTCSFTVYITAERCLCIVFPLKIRRLITFKRTLCIIIFFTVTTMLSAVPVFCTFCIDWMFYPERNRTLLGLIPTNNREKVEVTLLTVNAVCGTLSVTLVVIFTSVSIYKLLEKSYWRRKSTKVQKDKSESLSRRDRTTVVMVVLIAIILVVCYTPSVVLCLVSCFEREFNIDGQYVNLFYVLWSFSLLLENVNSSVNIILYLKMSSNYRLTFSRMFLKR